MSITIFTRNLDGSNGSSSLNVSNRNFGTLWAALGLEFSYGGEIDGRTLKDAVRNLDPLLVGIPVTRDGNFIDCGIEDAQIEWYISNLKDICEEAEQKEVPICWA